MDQLSLFDAMPTMPAMLRGRQSRIPNWTSRTAQELWTLWREQFESDDEAIATAVWMANRMFKPAAKSTKRKFYSIKDAFISRYSIEGRVACEEVKVYPDCNGAGKDEFDNYCERCDGSGIWQTSYLFLHEFYVAGQKYSLHRTPRRRCCSR